MGKSNLIWRLNYSRKILKETDPKKQQDLGRQVSGFVKEIWEESCREIVYKGNLAKFSQNKGLGQQLDETGDREMVEASPKDKIWGIGMGENDFGVENPKNWQGTNWLGKAIQRVRTELFE